MRIKENKETKFSKLEKKKQKKYDHTNYESSLCKESRFKTFCGQYEVSRLIEYVRVKFA